MFKSIKGYNWRITGVKETMNEGNLKPVRTASEARERGKKGGKKSGEARRERKALKEQLLLLLETGNARQELCTALLDKALSGDVRAFEVIRDTIGEKPVEKVAQTTADGNDSPVNDLSKIPTETLLKMAEAAGVVRLLVKRHRNTISFSIKLYILAQE